MKKFTRLSGVFLVMAGASGMLEGLFGLSPSVELTLIGLVCMGVGLLLLSVRLHGD